MPHFEIFLPKSGKTPMDLRLRLQAASWVEALKAGLGKVGEDGSAAENVLCDIKEDNSIHVTDATSGRVFQITELPEPQTAVTQPDLDPRDEAVTQPDMPAAVPPTPVPKTAPKPAPASKPAAQPLPKPQAVRVALPADSPTTATESGIGRALDFTSEATADLLEEVFEISDRVNQLADKRQALFFLLDLAMNTIGTDAGSILLADINTDELAFGAARGPKAEQVMQFRVKMGQGIAGYCAESGVGVAVSDVTRDPRFYAAISQKIGYPTRSILCVPMQAEEQIVGALELINKKKNDTFSERDLGVAGFLGQQLARYLLRSH